jgi:hypothetical protein
MKNLLKNRKALSTVVTTLIILVVSVLLAGVVTYYAINVVSTRVQQESLNLQYAHVWYSTTNTEAEAAILITNTGGRDVVLQNIAVRGQSVPADDLCYFAVTTPGDLAYIPSGMISANITAGTPPVEPSGYAVPSGTALWLNVTSAITLNSGGTIAVYMTGKPGSVSVNDVGLTIAISIFSAQATYYKETNVNAA